MSDKPSKCDLCDEETDNLEVDNCMDADEYHTWRCPKCRGEPWAYDD